MEDTKHHIAVFLGFVTLVVPILSQVPPSAPILTGPNIITAGDTITLICTTFGGDPIPTVKWYEGSVLLDDSQTNDASGVSTNDYTFTVTKNNHLAVYECRVDNNVLQNPLAATWFIQVYSVPNSPVLTGPSVVISGTPNQWTCVSLGGYPKPTMKLSYDTTVFPTTSITETTKYDAVAVAYNNTKVVTWTPTTANNGATIYCEVNHPTIPNKPQITSLKITVNSPLAINAPQLTYTPTLGTNLVLVCNVTGVATTVSWYKDNSPTPIIIANNARLSNGNINIPSLSISNAQTSDSGQYVCQATDGTKTVNTNTINVTVQFKPTVTIQQPTYSVNYGNPVTLVCTVSAIPFQTKVYWQKDNTLIINSGDPVYSGGTPANPSLTINSAIIKDQGQYRCYAENPIGSGNSATTTLTVVGDSPVAIIGAPNYQVLVGNTITIGCTVTANPVVQNVYWERNIGGSVITIGPTTNPSKYGGSTTVNPSLTINNVDFSDEGNYRCFATNIVGTGSSNQGFLDVNGLPPTVAVTLPNYQVDFGNTVTLGCTVTANPVHTTVYWKKIVNGVTTNVNMQTSNNKYSGSTVSSPSLVINNANLDDRASYVCYAENSIGVGQSTSTVLNVLGEIPKVVVAQPQYNTDYGKSVALVCTVTANPIHTIVYWQKIQNGVTNTINVANSNNKFSGSTVTTPSLTINNADLSDEATYICFATNGVGTGQSAQTFVDVNGGLPLVAVLSNSYSVVVGGTVTLQCVVNANPAHTVVRWQKIVNGVITDVILSSNNRLSGSTVSTPSLTVSQADFSDEGNYICTATNPVGTGTSQQTFLDVTGTPPVATVSQSLYQGNYAQSVTLVCSVIATPTASKVYWKRLQNGQMTDISLANTAKYSGSTVGSPSLTISDLNLNDEGFYQCFADNTVGTGSSQQTFLDVLGNIPTVKVLSNAYNVIVGNTVTLGCQVDATPKETIVFWQRLINGQLTNIDLATNNNNKYSGSKVVTPSLTITNAQNSDEGNYICYATNLAGTGSSSQTFLDVVGSPPVVSIAQSSYSVNIGNPVTLFCTVSATPTEFKVYWTRKIGNQAEELITTTNSGKYSGSTVNSPSLVILQTDLSDTATYKCFAENSVGIGQSNTTTLNVLGNPPIVTIEKSTYTVNYGNTVTLTCTVTSQPLHTSVYWKKVQGGQQVPVDMTSSKYSGSTVTTPSLTISNTNSIDETFYICYATNIIGTGQSSQTYLDVLGSQPDVKVLSNSYAVLTGQTATLECIITANPAASSVQWYKMVNGQQQAVTATAGKYNTPTVNSPNLIVYNAQSSDKGYYVCSATNIVATASSAQTFLDVTGNIPSVTISLPNYATKEGTTVTLGCTIIASPAATRVYWARVDANGQTSQINMNNNKYSGSTVSNPSLTIFNPILSDEGDYICYAENVIGLGISQKTYLDVTGSIPTVTVAKSLYTVDINQPVTLECTVVASPVHTAVYWQRIVNGAATTITAGSQARYSGSTVTVPSLTISSVEFSDEAYYVCFATNEVGTGQSAQTYLDVVGSRPIVNIGSTSYSVNYANTITLVCTVTTNPLHTSVSWTKIKNGISTNIVIGTSGKYSGSTVAQPSLTITNAVNDDEAFYVCSATNLVGTGQSSQTYLDVVGEIPVVQILSNYYSVEIGKSVTVECQVQANPAQTSVQWQRVVNGQVKPLDISNINKYTGGIVKTPSLTILNTVDSDEGYYICTATNAVGTGSSTQSYLDVTGSILSVTIPQPSYNVNYGQDVQLVCTVSGSPAATAVYWEKAKNGVITRIDANTNTNKYSGSTTATPSLTVRNADSTDQAVYTCFAENVIGRGQSSQTQLQIIGSIPSVTIGTGYTVNLGNSITIKCTVFATPSATSVEWNKFANGVPYKLDIASQPNKYSGGNVNTPSLTINNAVDSDEAYYTCSATNAAGTGTSTQSYLDVLGSIPVVTISQPQYSVVVGNTVTMQCSITANPAHNQVTWKKIINGSPVDVPLGGRYTGSTVANPSLTITNAADADKGYYVCYATNSVGQGQSAQTYLNVVGSIPIVNVLSTSYSVNIGNSITLQCTVMANPEATSVKWQRIVNNNAVNIDMSNTRYSGSTVFSPSLVINNIASGDKGFYICLASNSVGTGQSSQTFLDVVGSIPQVTVPVPNYSVNRGASITLECSYTANPAATLVSWEKIVSGQATSVMSTTNNKYGGSTVQSPSLIINDATESDEASYICKVTNNIGTGISTATSLDVVGNIPVVTALPLAYSVNVGSSVTLGCTVVADPLHTSVQWKKIVGGVQSNIVVSSSGGKYSGATVGSPSLVINNAAFSDQGTYICYATNSVGTGMSTQVVVGVAGSPPVVTLSQNSFSANYGESVTLGCVILADPKETSVFWQMVVAGNSPVTIDLTNTDKYSGSTVSQPSLTIKNVGSGDIANYICFAANSIGTGQSSQGPLNVAGSTPTVKISQTTYPINIGNTITIDCTVISKPSHTSVYWTRQIGTNQPETITTTGSTSTKYGGSTIVSPSLTIYNVQESDQGTYICHATNIVGKGHSSQAFLDVVGNAPVVTATSVPSIPVGSAITIQCNVMANPAVFDIIWSKFINNQPTPIDIINNKRMSGGTKTNPSLTINPVEQDDEGNYICQARNDVGVGSSNQVYVDVTGDPPTLVVISPTKITIVEGETITAKCTAQGTPAPKFSWFREGSSTVIATTAVYEVVNAPRTAIGTYICRASNNYGSTEATVIVDVQYKPNVTISKTTTSFYGSGKQSINIPCSYISNPAATSVFWTRMLPGTGSSTTGNTNVIIIDGTKYHGGTFNTPSLTIYNLDKSDEGSYKCSAANSIGQGDSNYVTLGVNTNAAPSYIRITPSQVTVEEGNGYTLTCEADGDPTPLYEWYYKDVKIYEGSVLKISSSVYNKNDGLHTCKATNKVGSRQATVDVDVQYAPVSNVQQNNFAPHLNEALTLQCDTRANPSATVWSWKYNGFSLDYYGKVYLVDMDSTADVGKYTCIAYNEVGQSADIEFTVSLGVGPTPAPKIVETVVPAGYLTGGEIAAICLAVLFGLLLIVIIIVCCVVQGCCRRKMKPEKERYVERVITREAEIPKAVREPSVVSVRELVAPRISYVDDSYRYVTATRPYYLPVVDATYDDQEHRRRTKKKRSKGYDNELARDDVIYLEERVIGSPKGEIITGPEMYFEAE